MDAETNFCQDLKNFAALTAVTLLLFIISFAISTPPAPAEGVSVTSGVEQVSEDAANLNDALHRRAMIEMMLMP